MPAKLTRQQFLDKAFSVHGDKYVYLAKYENVRTKIPIYCPAGNHHIFWQRAAKHLQGGGCPKCARITTGEKNKISNLKTNEQFLQDAFAVHGDKYVYLAKYKCDADKMPILCNYNNHGIFWQAPTGHLQGYGCTKCAIEFTGTFNRKTKQKFVAEAIVVHDNKYEYPGDYISAAKNMMMKCPIHGEFWQIPDCHLNGVGCPKCVSNISKPEIEWLNSLGIPDDKEHRNCTIKLGVKYIRPDGFIPETNTIYEFYGDYWHGNLAVFLQDKINHATKTTMAELNKKTMEREQLIKQAGYNLVFIWENDWKQQKKLNNK